MKTDQSSIVHSINTDFKANRRTGDAPSRPSPLSRKRTSKGSIAKVAIIREDLVALTGNALTAVVLNQLLYWTERLPDLDKLIKEELASNRSDSLCYGWFYKSSEELAAETLLGFDRRTIRRYINEFIEKGWLSERANPKNKWNKTTQYRINIKQLYWDLRILGYDLPGFPLEEFQDLCSSLPAVNNSKQSKTQLIHHTPQNQSKRRTRCSEHSNAQERTIECYTDEQSNVIQSAFFNLTETTSEITNREHTERVRKNLKILGEEKKEQVGSSISSNPFMVQGMVKAWEKHIAGNVYLTQKRKQKLASVLQTHFQSDMAQWDALCQRVKSSPFLMGEGQKGWRVSLDWILIEENLIKVLEGNFDGPAAQKRALAMQAKQSEERRILDILTSIEDPVWRDWCTHFMQGSYSMEPLCCFELESISNARFLEIEDDKLIWVGSTDQKVLNKIEDMRIRLSPVFTRLFPNVRTLRTRLIEPQSTTERIELC